MKLGILIYRRNLLWTSILAMFLVFAAIVSIGSERKTRIRLSSPIFLL